MGAAATRHEKQLEVCRFDRRRSWSSSIFGDFSKQDAGAKERVRASHVTQLHFQVGTIRTLQGYPSPTNRFPPQSPKTTLVSQVLEGTTDNCWLANTCQPFRTESPLLSPSASQSCLVLAGRSAAREQQFGARESERASGACPGEDAPAALTPRDARGPGSGLRRRRVGGRTHGRAPARPAIHLGAAGPAVSPRGRPRASPPHRGCPASACAPRCRACRPHSPHPLRELVTSCPRPISVRGQSVAPCRSRRLVCFPLPTLSTAVARADRGGGTAERERD